jgi:hypothetical protein
MGEDKKLVLRLLHRVWSPRWDWHGDSINFNASLVFTKDRLIINYLGLVKLHFLKEDIIDIEIERHTFLNWIILKHNIDNYPKYLAFSSLFTKTEDLLEKIRSTGFLDKNLPTTDQSIIDDVRKIQKKEIIPPYLWALIAMCIVVIFGYAILTGAF